MPLNEEEEGTIQVFLFDIVIFHNLLYFDKIMHVKLNALYKYKKTFFTASNTSSRFIEFYVTSTPMIRYTDREAFY